MHRSEFEALLEEELDEVGELMSPPPRKKSIYTIPGEKIPGYVPPKPPTPRRRPRVAKSRTLWDKFRDAAAGVMIATDVITRRPDPNEVPHTKADATQYQKPEEELASIRAHRPEAALMEHLGQMAARARNEAEAEALIGALVPLAAGAIPRAAPALLRTAPTLITGLATLTRGLRGHPTTRPMVCAIPTILRNTARDIGRQTAGSRTVPPRIAARTLARQTVRVLGSPQQASRALRTSRALSQAHSQHTGAPPAGSGGQLPGNYGMPESEVRSLVVGAGRTHPPLSKKRRDPSTTATMDRNRSWNPDFPMRIQNALHHPQGPGGERFREIYFERTGIWTGALDEHAVRVAHTLLVPAGKLIFLLPIGDETRDQVERAAKSVIPPGLFRNIRTRFIPAYGIARKPHLMLMATKM